MAMHDGLWQTCSSGCIDDPKWVLKRNRLEFKLSGLVPELLPVDRGLDAISAGIHGEVRNKYCRLQARQSRLKLFDYVQSVVCFTGVLVTIDRKQDSWLD